MRHLSGAHAGIWNEHFRHEAPYDGDLLRANHSVEWWGVTDLKTFYWLLREATPAEAQAA